MSHHLRNAQVSLSVALDNLVSAERLAEDITAGRPNPNSLEIARIASSTKLAYYGVNTAGWVSAERALQGALEPLSRLIRALAKGGRLRERTTEERVIIDQLVQARKGVRGALLNLRLRKGRP